MRSGFDRTDIDDLKLPRLGKGLAQLIAQLLQPLLFVGARAIGFAIEAGVDQFEIEDRNALRCRSHRLPCKQGQQAEKENGDS